MKKLITLLLVVSLVFHVFPSTTYALSDDQSRVIQKLVDDAVHISGTPGISVAVISDNQTYYFYSGYTSNSNAHNPSPVDSNTLYEIGSLSKAFTALGILLLEEQGLLSTDDSIEEYLPWFYANYQNKQANLTISHLLHHSSGFTQNHSDFPRGEGRDMLRQSVESFVGSELDFAPGSAYSYNNLNYNLLGLIIEEVSGQQYESFMKEKVFEPLGLHHTYLYHSDASLTGQMATGHRHAFFQTYAFDAPLYDSMKPAGFIISSSADMARWINIHLGLAEDIPDEYINIVEQSHQFDLNGPSISDNTYYASGWISAIDIEVLGHAGQTPSFMSNMLLFTKEKQGVIFLSNGGNVENELAWNIKSVLDGDLNQQYEMSARQKSDMIFSGIIILLLIISIIQLVLGIRNRIKAKPQFSKQKIFTISLNMLSTIIMLIVLLNYPNITGSGWTYIFDWNPPMITILLFVLPLFFAVTMFYSFTQKIKTSSKKK